MLCATPRSGSTLLCDLLESTGVAGHPAEHFEALDSTGLPRQPRQYFNPGAQLTGLLAPTDPGAPDPELRLEEAFAAGTTSNGVFATKVMWGFLPDLIRRARTRTGQPHVADVAVLERLLPGLRYVRVTRRDKVAQAVSLWTAVQTRVWRVGGDDVPAAEPVYSFDGIDHLVRQLTSQEAAWADWLQARHRVAPVVVYEELVADPQAVIGELLAALGLADAPVESPAPRLRRQAGDRSAEWIARYHDEREAQSRGPVVAKRSPGVTWHRGTLAREDRWGALEHGGATIWFTGLPASGKSTIAAALERELLARGRHAYLVDGDNVRHGLSGDLGFAAEDRSENVRRVAHVARLFADAGTLALVSLVSPARADRENARRLHDAAELAFVEVFVDTPVEECARRDPKGLYARARQGQLSGLTGRDAPYEPPAAPDVVIHTPQESVDASVRRLLALLADRDL